MLGLVVKARALLLQDLPPGEVIQSPSSPDVPRAELHSTRSSLAFLNSQARREAPGCVLQALLLIVTEGLDDLGVLGWKRVCFAL